MYCGHGIDPFSVNMFCLPFKLPGRQRMVVPLGSPSSASQSQEKSYLVSIANRCLQYVAAIKVDRLAIVDKYAPSWNNTPICFEETSTEIFTELFGQLHDKVFNRFQAICGELNSGGSNSRIKGRK
jgi:hypothetical protein